MVTSNEESSKVETKALEGKEVREAGKEVRASESADSEVTTTCAQARAREGVEGAMVGGFPPETFSKICDRIADGESLNKICDDPDMPSRKTVYQWIAADPDLQAEYEQAVAIRADILAEEIVDIADQSLPGTRKKMKKNEDGTTSYEEVEVDNVERSRLKIDSRKWYAGKVAPKKYGDKVADVTVNTAVSVQGLLAAIGGDQRSLLPPGTEIQETETKPV